MRAMVDRLGRLIGRPMAGKASPKNPSAVLAMRLEGRRGIAGTLRRLSPAGHFWQPTIDTGGKEVLFWGRRTEAPSQHVWVTALEDFEPHQLTHGQGTEGHPAWFPDGSRVVYFKTDAVDWQPAQQFSPDRPAASLRVLDRATSRETHLTEGPYIDERPAVSPDGSTIVFVSNRSGRLNLWRVSSHGEGLRQVTQGSGPDYRPAFSGDGRTVAYFAPSANGSHQLKFMSWPEAEPLEPRMRQQFHWVHGPSWSADGRTLLVHALAREERQPRLWTIDLDSGDAEPMALPGVNECSHGTWDAAERWICFDARLPVNGG